jgi:hypothetical protein
MTASGWKTVIVLLLVVAAVWVVLRRGAPEERLAGRYRDLCAIAADNVATPARGVERMGAFFAAHGPDMLHDYGTLVADIERIDDDKRHDERARQAGRTLRAPLDACGDTFARFFEAVDGDDRAKAILSRGFERLGRTLELLFGDADSSELRTLVARLRSTTAR